MRRAEMSHGSLAVLDHRAAWETRIVEPFETVHIFIPVLDLTELSDEIGKARIDTLNCPISSERHDEVMLHLALSLLPAIRNPEQVSTLFADHIYGAIRLHLALTYGGLIVPQEQARGGLAPWQERLVKELLLDDLTGNPSLAGLAQACGVSTRHFTRAFRESHGTAPHRWLLQQKVERAKHLLATSALEISEIAHACGFADQSHLTRVFRGLVGAPPAAWRRARRH
jgi:AraC-like DNA-binding protein